MDGQQKVRPLRYDIAPNSNLRCSHFVTTPKFYPPILRRVAMSIADTYVRTRIDTATKERAAAALEAIGYPSRMLFAY